MIVYTNKINIIKTLIFEKFKDNDKGLDRSVNNGVITVSKDQVSFVLFLCTKTERKG